MNASSESDEFPNPRVVAETLKFLANSFYGYQVMDWSRHTVPRYVSDKWIHGTFHNKMFRSLVHINDQLFEIELYK